MSIELFHHALSRREHNRSPWFPVCEDPNCIRQPGRWTRLWRDSTVCFAGHSYCADCLERAMARQLQQLLSTGASSIPVPYRVPLGLVLLSRDMITESQLREALAMQRKEGHGKLGDWLIQLGYASEDQITAGLGMQWGCPVYPSAAPVGDMLEQPLPLALLDAARIFPVHYSLKNRTIHIAFLERVDYTVLYAIERMTRCRTVPCVSLPSAIARAIANLRRETHGQEIVFDAVHSAREMARVARSYLSALGAHEVATCACSHFVWLRFTTRIGTTDLLFRTGPLPPFHVS